MLRFSLILAGVAVAVVASAADAFSNIEGSYDKTGYVVSPISTIGYRLTSGLSGTLNGFRAAMNNLDTRDGAPRAFTFSLYTNTPEGQVGALLGSYSGRSTGKAYTRAKKETVSVPASGLSLVAGTSYWLVATSSEQLVWSWVDDGVRMPNIFTTSGGAPNYGSYNAGTFSVQVGPSVRPVPEPGTLAALGLGLLALGRRRRA